MQPWSSCCTVTFILINIYYLVPWSALIREPPPRHSVWAANPRHLCSECLSLQRHSNNWNFLIDPSGQARSAAFQFRFKVRFHLEFKFAIAWANVIFCIEFRNEFYTYFTILIPNHSTEKDRNQPSNSKLYHKCNIGKHIPKVYSQRATVEAKAKKVKENRKWWKTKMTDIKKNFASTRCAWAFELQPLIAIHKDREQYLSRRCVVAGLEWTEQQSSLWCRDPEINVKVHVDLPKEETQDELQLQQQQLDQAERQQQQQPMENIFAISWTLRSDEYEVPRVNIVNDIHAAILRWSHCHCRTMWTQWRIQGGGGI